MKIYIIRHGETDANKEGMFQGWTDVPLNDAGKALAVETGKGLGNIHFDAAYSSTLMRAKQTAEILLRETGNTCPVYYDERIKEISAGEYEGKHFSPEYGDMDPVMVRKFFDDPFHLQAFPGGESVNDVMARTQAFLRELAQKDYETVLVSTHGCAVRCMLNFLYDDPQDFWHGHVPFNCVINVVETINGELKLTGDDLVFYDPSQCIDRYVMK